jgi:hypothetical protein
MIKQRCAAVNLNRQQDAEKVRPGLFQPRKAKSAIFALLHFSNTCVFEK